MPRYRLTIAYDGTDFHGWQKQELRLAEGQRPEDILPGSGANVAYERLGETVILRTVQHVVERAICEVVREPIAVMGASRTDSGVHARAQIAAFTTGDDRSRGWPIERGTDPMLRAINSRLPDDVLVTRAEVVDDAFDPVTRCTAKGYSYTLHVSAHRPLWDRRFVQHIWRPLDAHAMKLAATRFVGEHDFAAFAAAGHGRQTTIRTVHACDVTELPMAEAGPLRSPSNDDRAPIPREEQPNETAWARRIRIDVSGNGFLWNMVRIIAGTLVDVGLGQRSADDVSAALQRGDRRLAGPTLPPTGLCLEWVRYE